MSDSAQSDNTNQDTKTDPKAKDDPAPQGQTVNIDEKLIAELKKYRTQAKELDAKLKQREADDLKNNQKWQELAELNGKEVNELRTENSTLKADWIKEKKISAIKQEAIKAGIRKEAMEDLERAAIDFPELASETNSEGDFINGAEKAIQRLKSTKAFWFKSATPKINSDSPSVTDTGGKLTTEMVLKLEKEYAKNPNPANAEKYKGALLEFRKQSSAK